MQNWQRCVALGSVGCGLRPDDVIERGNPNQLPAKLERLTFRQDRVATNRSQSRVPSLERTRYSIGCLVDGASMFAMYTRDAPAERGTMTGCGDDGTAMTTFHEDLQQLLPDGDELLMLGVTGSTAYGLSLIHI